MSVLTFLKKMQISDGSVVVFVIIVFLAHFLIKGTFFFNQEKLHLNII
jgi:hypothetical protein